MAGRTRIVLILILLSGIIWRFWDFGNRWVLNQDQARDLLIARYAWENGQLPLLGSPSSAGPFNFGAMYFVLIMLVEKISPIVAGPWIIFTIISSLTILVAYWLGKVAINKTFGLFLAMAFAWSWSLVYNAPDMLNTVAVLLPATVAYICAIKLVGKFSWKWAVWLGVSVGLALNMHFQSLGLLPLILLAGVWAKRSFWKVWILAGLGLVSTFAINIIFDILNMGIWIKSVVEYYTVGVKKFYVPVRWLWEVRDFWPQKFGEVLVGQTSAGYVLMITLVVMLGVVWRKRRKIEPSVWFMGFVFLGQVIMLRYYGGTRSREYFFWIYPMLLFISSWAIYKFYSMMPPGKYQLVFLVVLLGLWGKVNVKAISQPSQVKIIYEIKQAIDKNVQGNVKFYKIGNSNMLTLPLMYLYDREGRLDESGTGVVTAIGKNGYDVGPWDKNQIGVESVSKKDIYSWIYINYPEAKR